MLNSTRNIARRRPIKLCGEVLLHMTHKIIIGGIGDELQGTQLRMAVSQLTTKILLQGIIMFDMISAFMGGCDMRECYVQNHNDNSEIGACIHCFIKFLIIGNNRCGDI